jgi:hypothetical protein
MEAPEKHMSASPIHHRALRALAEGVRRQRRARLNTQTLSERRTEPDDSVGN